MFSFSFVLLPQTPKTLNPLLKFLLHFLIEIASSTMKFPKALFHLSTSSTSIAEQSPFRPISILVANFSSSNSASGQFSSKRSQYDEESRAVKVSVWWDFENCHLPAGSNVFKVGQIITSAIRNSGIKGPITITAFGDVLQLSRTNQEALSATGINLTHVPQGGKNSADRSLLMELITWISHNPPPAHLFLISSDRDFASVLHKLRMSNYNILLAGKEHAPGVLCSAASIMWDWNSLIKGENFTGKHFNQPPDGPYNSWYGHYKTPLLDPFASNKRSCNVKTEESRESKSNSDSSKVCCIPEEVVTQIRLILSSYPKGMSIKELKEELSKSKVMIDKDFFGHKSFSRFLLSMPKILQVKSAGDGLFFVHAVTQETPKPLDSVTSKMDKHEVVNDAVEARRDDTLGNMHQDVKENDQESRLQENSQESIEVNQQDLTINTENPVKENQLALTTYDDHGFLKKLKRLFFGSPDMDKTLKGAVGNNESVSEGILSQILKRFKFWGRDTELSNGVTSTQEQIDLNDIFTKDSFWIDLESFINTPRGYTIVSHSKTREAMAKNLQSEGPSSLKSLDESQMLNLVSILISEKNWIQENSSNELPFRVSRSSNMPFGLSNTNPATGLRSIFKSQCDEQDSDEKSKNVSNVEEKSGERTRGEVFADCQKLTKKITEEHTREYNIGCFRRDFLKTYGYRLDIKKLGYDKLQTLLQLMPGVKVELGYIVPLNSSSDQTDDSSFEELGPVSDTKQGENTNGYEEFASEDEDSDVEREEASETKSKKQEQNKNGDGDDDDRVENTNGYEESVSGDEDSDVEREEASEMKKKKKKKKQEQNKNGDGDDDERGSSSYLLELLDSWDNGSDGKKVKSVGRKQKGVKSYSFVADSEERVIEDKLVDGILGSLKKSSEIRVER